MMEEHTEKENPNMLEIQNYFYTNLSPHSIYQITRNMSFKLKNKKTKKKTKTKQNKRF